MTEMLMHDTLTADTALIRQMRLNPDFAYAVGTERESVWSMLMRLLGRGLNWLFSTNVNVEYWVEMAVALVIGGVLLYFLWRRGIVMFGRSRGQSAPVETGEENINEIDFAAEKERALAVADYGRAMRLVYLETLKRLSDTGLIEWQPFKTPTQYTYEVTRAEFRKMTNLFLRVRYGRMETGVSDLQQMEQWQQAVLRQEGGGA